MKAVIKVVFCAFFVHSLYLHAESEIRMRSIENRVKNLESNKKELYEPITPNAGPKVKNGLDLYLTAEFLYWTARLDTLTYAKSGIGNILDSRNPSKGHIHSVDWQWDPGFKVGMGWTFCHSGWDMQLKYTWFYTNVGDSKEGRYLYPGFSIGIPPTVFATLSPIRRAHAHWDLHYQTGDLELGRNYLVNHYLKLRPFVGVKGTWQKQDYRAFYESAQFQGQQDVYDIKASFDHSLWGVGLCTGLNTSWQFTDWFSLYGSFSLSGMWLHYNVDRKDVFSIVSSTQPKDLVGFTTVNMQNVLRNLKPVFEFGVGLRLETYFDCNRYHILFQAGWETQIWPSQTLYLSLGNHYDRFDLSLHGLTVKGRFDF